jgi:mannose-6-phosphate isomerase
MGAHPAAPSGVERGGRHTTLDAVIAADPAGELGEDCARRFGGRLPFLLKVLAAQQALSIQVHPSRAQAEAGYRAENERGLAPGDKSRNYADDWPKPEILCALTRFEVLAGMRDPADAAALLRELAVPALEPLAAELMSSAGENKAGENKAGENKTGENKTGESNPGQGDARARVLARVLGWPADISGQLVDDVIEACGRVVAEAAAVDAAAADEAALGDETGAAALEGAATGARAYAATCAAIIQIAANHPGDLGIVASLLLRHAVLEPGQAVFLPAGGLHSYLHGTGIELLANSDNVVRAGLTPKHIDIPELLKLTVPAVEVPVLAPRDLGDGIVVYDTPAPEFRLYRASLGPAEVTLPGEGPRLVLCVAGALHLRDAAGSSLRLSRGEACFVPFSDKTIPVFGPATAFIATVG